MTNSPIHNRTDNRKLIAYIEALIAGGRFAPGEKLPSLRTLARQFDLTDSAAHRAIKTLCERELIELRPGAGSFVRPPQFKKKLGDKVLSVVVWDHTMVQSYCSFAMQGLQEAAGEAGWKLKIHFAPYWLPDEIYRIRDLWDCDAAVFLGCYDVFDIERLAPKRPCVGVEMQRDPTGIFSMISVDPFAAAEIACRHYAAGGVKHVQVVYHWEMPVHLARAEIFIRTWEQGGGTVERLPINDLEPHFVIDPDGAGYFAGGSHFEKAAKAQRLADGRCLADNLNMLSVDGKSLLFPDFEPSNTLSVDWVQIGADAFAEAVRRVIRPGIAPRRISVVPRLIMHASAPRPVEHSLL